MCDMYLVSLLISSVVHYRKKRREYRLSQQASFQDSMDSESTATPMTLSRDSRSFDYLCDSLLSPPVIAVPGDKLLPQSPLLQQQQQQQQHRPPLVRTECVASDSERGTLDASTSRSTDDELSSVEGVDDDSSDVDPIRRTKAADDRRCKRTRIPVTTPGSCELTVPDVTTAHRRRCPNGLLTPLPNGNVVGCSGDRGLFNRPKTPADVKNLTPSATSNAKTLPLKDNRVKTTAVGSRRCVTLGKMLQRNKFASPSENNTSGDSVELDRLSKDDVVDLWRSSERRLGGQLCRALREKEKLEQKLAMLLPETVT